MSTTPPRFLGLIPARGGSKRLPRKNLLPLAGRPLLAWTIASARGARLLDRVILSTDDAEIAATGQEYGVEVPFMRPPELAGDKTATSEVMQHALQTLAAADDLFEYIVVLQPTSPLRSAADIDAAIELFIARQADAVISVCETDHPPEWCNKLPSNHSMADFFRPGIRSKRSQDLPKSYRLNGALYVYNVARLLATGSLEMDDNSYAYPMPRERSVDIDSAIDLEVARVLLERAAAEALP